MRLIIILLAYTFILIGCPNGEPIDPGPILPTPDPTPIPEDIVVPQLCKIELQDATFQNYQDLLDQLEETLVYSSCTANDLLCVYVERNTPCDRIWIFPTMDSIPRHTIKDECGNTVIFYIEDDL